MCIRDSHYTISEIRKWNRCLSRYMRIRRGLNVKRMLKRVLSGLGIIARATSLSEKVNHFLLAEGHAAIPLAANAIQKMVDIHVPQSNGEYLWGQPGFSPDTILNQYLPCYTIIFDATYHHLKAPFHRLGWCWRQVNNQLKRRYPDGGADIIMAFRKTS